MTVTNRAASCSRCLANSTTAPVLVDLPYLGPAIKCFGERTGPDALAHKYLDAA
jgi:hypothetical protein